MNERDREGATDERAGPAIPATDRSPRRDHAPAQHARELAPPVARFDRMGNRAMLGLLRSGRLLPRRAVSVPDDPIEVAADRAADQVVSDPRTLITVPGAAPGTRGTPGEATIATYADPLQRNCEDVKPFCV